MVDRLWLIVCSKWFRVSRLPIKLRRTINQSGFSLIEIVLVVAAVGLLVLLVGSMPNSIRLVTRSRNISVAREVAIKAIEDKRELGYLNLPFGTDTATFNNLPEGSLETTIEPCDNISCSSAQNTKILTIKVFWKEAGVPRNIEIKTLVSEGGLD